MEAIFAVIKPKFIVLTANFLFSAGSFQFIFHNISIEVFQIEEGHFLFFGGLLPPLNFSSLHSLCGFKNSQLRYLIEVGFHHFLDEREKTFFLVLLWSVRGSRDFWGSVLESLSLRYVCSRQFGLVNLAELVECLRSGL